MTAESATQLFFSRLECFPDDPAEARLFAISAVLLFVSDLGHDAVWDAYYARLQEIQQRETEASTHAEPHPAPGL